MLQWRGATRTQDFPNSSLSCVTRLLRERDTRATPTESSGSDSGKLVGYARWLLPTAGQPQPASRNGRGRRCRATDADRRRRWTLATAGAWWGPRTDVDELDAEQHHLDVALLLGGPYLGKFDITLSACRLKCIRSCRVILARHSIWTTELELLCPSTRRTKRGSRRPSESGIRRAEQMGLPILDAVARPCAGRVLPTVRFIGGAVALSKIPAVLMEVVENMVSAMLYEVPKNWTERYVSNYA